MGKDGYLKPRIKGGKTEGGNQRQNSVGKRPPRDRGQVDRKMFGERDQELKEIRRTATKADPTQVTRRSIEEVVRPRKATSIQEEGKSARNLSISSAETEVAEAEPTPDLSTLSPKGMTQGNEDFLSVWLGSMEPTEVFEDHACDVVQNMVPAQLDEVVALLYDNEELIVTNAASVLLHAYFDHSEYFQDTHKFEKVKAGLTNALLRKGMNGSRRYVADSFACLCESFAEITTSLVSDVNQICKEGQIRGDSEVKEVLTSIFSSS